uniref:Sucrase-isomaltase, intestinal-like n=1 Tax=Saccoglossus kowalevskii TaxID=10224 RepID=A0ABM0MPH1_SACKO|nr:PREDICTED: sucrase-isomaltase, intestinal-like [Saccoglossus kowalevskii]
MCNCTWFMVALVLLQAVTTLLAVAPEECPTNVPENERRDCHSDPGSTEESCWERDCTWCESNDVNVPWCFYNTDPAPYGDCPTYQHPKDRVDCHPDSGSTQPSCESRGCLWCETAYEGAPWCFYSEGVAPEPIMEGYRVDCLMDQAGGESLCRERGCYYDSSNRDGVPWCYFPPDDRGYRIVGEVQDMYFGHRIDLRRDHDYTLFGGDVDEIRIDIEMQTDERLHVKIYDPNNIRFEVPHQMPRNNNKASNPLYQIQYSNDPIFTLNVTRTDNGRMIWDTSIGGLVYEDQYLQLATKLGSEEIYGFGEHEHHSFRHDIGFRTHGMYSRDQPPVENGNLYGVYPYYMSIEEDFNAHGVLLLNSNAQDVTLQPGPAITYRTIGGVLDYWIFLGPTPENVAEQLSEAVGRTFMPPYWSMGFQLSRYGYNHIDVVKETVNRVLAYDIPLDVQFGDIDYMDRYMDFTYDKVNYAGLPEYVNELKTEEGIHYIIILDPCIANSEPAGTYPPYDEGSRLGVWVNDTNGIPVVGKDMNEPASFVTGSLDGCDYNKWNNPPYHPNIFGNVLADKTLCPDFVHFAGKHYDIHSLYGLSEGPPSLAAARAATGKRSIVISRSTYPGSSQHVGHWLGDNYSQWNNMHFSIIGMLEMNLFGMPYVGADICGFINDAQYEMCLRWHQLGAFYPFSRNHNGLGYREQDPGAWDDSFGYNVRDILFITDRETHTTDRQFLWGASLMISPVLDQGNEVSERGSYVTLNAPSDYIPLHVRGGYIMPTQEPARSTVYSRVLPLGVIVALDDNDSAAGKIFWDDGDSIDTYENGEFFTADFSASSGELQGVITHDGYRGVDSLVWGTVRVLGVATSVTSVSVNGAAHYDYSYNEQTQVMLA